MIAHTLTISLVCVSESAAQAIKMTREYAELLSEFLVFFPRPSHLTAFRLDLPFSLSNA